MDKSKGFTIIELIITLAILSFGIIGIYSTFSPVASLTHIISSRFTAAYLAQEGLEIIRNMRDNNFIGQLPWDNGLLICQLGCQADYKTGTLAESSVNQLQAFNPSNFLKLNGDGLYSYDAGVNARFTRKITISQEDGGDVLKITVRIDWSYNNQPYSYSADSYLYNWYQ